MDLSDLFAHDSHCFSTGTDVDNDMIPPSASEKNPEGLE